MARVEFDIESQLSPERILAGLTDFPDRRPDLWPGLDRSQYRVFQVGDTWADVREGTSKSIWARERYDWSQPGTVRWEVTESSFCRPGSYVQTQIRPDAEDGSRIHVIWERHALGLGSRLMLGLIVLTRGAPVKSSLRKGLQRIAAQSS
jgi:polyketide cyclase/dehydrase/lipid transport protein